MFMTESSLRQNAKHTSFTKWTVTALVDLFVVWLSTESRYNRFIADVTSTNKWLYSGREETAHITQRRCWIPGNTVCRNFQKLVISHPDMCLRRSPDSPNNEIIA
jgi:hypothetical protein